MYYFVQQEVDRLFGQEPSIDAVILGCTHYPFLRDVRERVAGEGIEVIDSSEAVARRVATLLDEHNLRAEEGSEQSCRYITFADESYLELLMKKAK